MSDGRHPSPMVSQWLRPAVERLARATSPAGSGILHGLRHDLTRVATLDQGWKRLCVAAWALGFTALELVPAPGLEAQLGPRFVTGRGRSPRSARRASLLDSSWAFELSVGELRVATLSARLGSEMLEFAPGEFGEAAQLLLRRFVEVCGSA